MHDSSIETQQKKKLSMQNSSEAVTKATISKQQQAAEQSMNIETDNYDSL
jgi:hypothetical protein